MAKPQKKTEPERVWVRVAVNMARVHRGQRLLIDPEDPEMQALLAAGALVLEEAKDG